MAESINARGVIATVVADLRASGDTGMVENLLEAEAAIADLEKKVAALIQAGKAFRNTVISTRGVSGMDNHDAALRDAEASLIRISGGAP